MNASKLYDKIINKFDKCYELYLELETLPKGCFIYKKIHGKDYLYLQYREKDKIKSKYISNKDIDEMKKKIARRKEIEKIIKKESEDAVKLIKILKVYDKSLHMMAKEEYKGFRLDMLPVNEKQAMKIKPNISGDDVDKDMSFDDKFHSMINDWSNNKIRMRDIEKYLITKIVS